mgnify:CR=1 FL=1
MHTTAARAPRGLVALLGNRTTRTVIGEARRLGVRVGDILDNTSNGGTTWARGSRRRRPRWSRT